MIRYGYNTQIQPPAPFMFVTFRNPVTGEERRDGPAQLDTAADRTLIPSAIAEQMNLPATGTCLIGGVGGTVAELDLFGVLLRVHTSTPHLIEVVAHPDEAWVLLGRDVANAHRMLLDGPGLGLEIG